MMHSIRTRFTLLIVIATIIALSVATTIAVVSIRKLGREDSDEMIHLTCTTGALNIESYFNSVESSTHMVSKLVQNNLSDAQFDELDSEVEKARTIFEIIAENTNGVLTYYFRIDPEVSETVKGFWYVYENERGFVEHETTDISQYDTTDTTSLVWFTVPKSTGESVWLPPYYTENLNLRVISYNEPVFWNDDFLGVIGIEINYEVLAKEVEDIKIYKTGYAFIVDENYDVIYHPQIDTMNYHLEMKALHTPSHHIGSNHVQYNYEGVEKEAVWILLSNGMRLYVSASQKEINSGWKVMIMYILGASFIILVVVSFTMMKFATRITKPLIDLTEAAKKVDQGDYDFSLNYNSEDEVGALTKTFKELTIHTKEHIDSLEEKAQYDPLTSVYNKGEYSNYIQKLQDQIDESKEKMEFAFVVFDCDNLKLVNDTYGHDKGDIYLKTASQLICQVFKDSPVFRIGGDEFAVILEGESYQNRGELIQKFEKMEIESCKNAESKFDEVNVAFGLAIYEAQGDTFVIDVARRADQLMYENKRQRKSIR